MTTQTIVRRWMVDNADDFRDDDTGEFNMTVAAECAFTHFPDIEDDDEMPYEAAFEAAEIVERNDRRAAR